MFTVGLTGGIGSGKSRAADFFRKRTVLVLDMDQLARDVVAPGTAVLEAIAGRFGADILDENGELNRGTLGDIVFSDPDQRRWLESVTHPAIRKRREALMCDSQALYAVLEIPLLAENHLESSVNRVLVIDCTESTQLDRASRRGSHSPGQVRKIMASQASRAQRRAIADDLVNNDGTQAQLLAQLEPLHQDYLSRAAQHSQPTA